MPSAPPAIPGPILESVRQVLARCGDTTALRSVQRAPGGFESTSVCLTTRRCSYFLKWNPSPAHGGFRAEADNLALLAATGAVCVPEVLAACDPAAAGAPGFLLQEWLTPPSRDAFARRVGRELGPAIAALHRARAVGEMRIGGYGPATAMTGGAQERWQTDWVTFYRDGLVRPELERAARASLLPGETVEALERLLTRLGDLLDTGEQRPSLLHGDLHRQNVLCNARGSLVLIDPHPLFAVRELELAYMDWVGYFPPAFWEAYDAAWPCTPGRAERRDLYLLLPRLRRLNWAGDRQQAQALAATARLSRTHGHTLP